MKMKCTKISGSWANDDAGDWEVKETFKTITFTRIRKPFFNWWFDGDKIVCKKDNQSIHWLNDWEDGTFTVYPNRNWTPFYFEPL